MPTYVITGANRGIGLEFVRQLASEPKNTIITGVRTLPEPSSPLAALRDSAPAKIHILQCDTSSSTSISEFSSATASALASKSPSGGARVDYLLNNAGILDSTTNSLELDPADLGRHIQINVAGPAQLVAALRSHSLLQHGSVVMNMSSGHGSIERTRTVRKGTGNTAYSISKAALNMLTAHQAMDLKSEGVIVISMAPGWTKTDMGGAGAFVEVEDTVKGMLGVIGGLKDISQTAKFFAYTGEEYDW